MIKTIIFIICFSFSCLAQRPGGIRSPATLDQPRALSESEIQSIGPFAWLDATNTITTDTNIITTNGGRCYVWLDKSANGNHFVAANNGTQRPYYYNNVVNGKPALWFNVVASFSRTWTTPIEPPFTYFIVYYQSNLVVSLFDGNNTGTQFRVGHSTANILLLGPASGVNTISLRVDYRQWHSICAVIYTNQYLITPKLELYADVHGKLSIPPTNAGTADAITTTYIGKNIVSSAYGGWIAEWILFKKKLNEDQRIGIMLYLNKKYGLPQNNWSFVP